MTPKARYNYLTASWELAEDSESSDAVSSLSNPAERLLLLVCKNLDSMPSHRIYDASAHEDSGSWFSVL